ncbi:MAG TPA: serine/threonine-protein kinase, partial [Microbacterium sp.]|nr:serine/threonine-protein kinase [Microbacterium sp.]
MTDVSISGAAVGELLDGRYRLEQLIGAGGMASVFKATDETLGRTVAIKVFRSGTTDPADGARRESEKKLLASLSHPALVTLFDAHLSNDERAYLVMEYVDGGTLESRLDQGPIAPLDAAALAADLGEALHVAHRAGIVHRDVKPSNILLRPPLTPEHTFRAILADFGIAYLVDTARVTTPGMAMGTAAYISPEQVRGAEPSPASDIYALGLVLIEALTGRRAFPQQSTHEAIAARLSMQPVVPGTFGYGWRSLLSAMTSLDPADRPAALEVASRGRQLDVVEGPLEVTGLLSESTGGEEDGAAAPPQRRRPPTAATALLPPAEESARVQMEEPASEPGHRASRR